VPTGAFRQFLGETLYTMQIGTSDFMLSILHLFLIVRPLCFHQSSTWPKYVGWVSGDNTHRTMPHPLAKRTK